MGLYAGYVLPRIVDRALRRPFITEQRVSLLKHAQGRVLEIGFGTGLNLPNYPPRRVRDLAVVEPNPGMLRRARSRIAAVRFPVSTIGLDGDNQRLEVEDALFDTVVSTWVLCTVPDPDRTLSEVFRVLQPGGVFLFIEHGLAPDPCVARWQNRLSGISRILGGGCHLNRPIGRIARSHPFEPRAYDEFFLDRGPRVASYLYRGEFVRPGSDNR